MRFLVDGADMAAFDGFERIVLLFDGGDADALQRARAQWKAAKTAGMRCDLLAASGNRALGEEGVSRHHHGAAPETSAGSATSAGGA